MAAECSRRDWVGHPLASALLWGVPVAIIVLTGSLANGWMVTAGWTVSLLVMGSACLLNARGCGRMHCYFTGPFFLLLAAVSLLYGFQLLPLGAQGWRYIGGVLLVGGVLLYVAPEWAWGRYRR